MTDEIVSLLEAGGAMEAREIVDALALSAETLSEQLATLSHGGKVVLTKKGKYALPKDVGLVAARTLVLRSGALVARPLDGGDDLFISEQRSLCPMHGDLVLVRPEPRHGERAASCRLVAITKRAHEQIAAVLTMVRARAFDKPAKKDRRRGITPPQAKDVPQVRPIDPRLPDDIQLTGDLRGAGDGALVLLRVTNWPERGARLRAAIERVLGDADDIRAQLRAIVARHGLHDVFPSGAVREADAMPARVSETDLPGRMDLRDLTLFTIDGDDAQDFDDAVSLERFENGVKLGVHITDVSYYVQPGTAIDSEALERGTSVYLPGLTLPMLPEALSNRLCSLVPNEDRLAMSLIMEMRGGAVVDHVLAPSVIRSKARLTYAQVNRMLDGLDNDIPEALCDTLRHMADVAGTLRKRRRARGSIDFDMPETAFTLDAEGRPTDVRARDRGEAERLIEDFMLLANETIAELARVSELPFLYRVHAKPDPDRVRSLEFFLGGLGIKVRLGGNPQPSRFQKVVDDTADKEEARLIKQIMLKSLKRAEYAPVPDGHFGLAARDYCHFTSPIRRYPDLQVHRMLKLLLSGGATSQWEGWMPSLAKQCSACEQKAALAERDADDLLKAHYMTRHIGAAFDGIVTGVTAWGVYVTLENTAEGLVPIRTLAGDYWLDQERQTLRGPGERAIRLGESVRVIVERVNVALAQVDFTLEV